MSRYAQEVADEWIPLTEVMARNLRKWRKAESLSQDALAGRMSHLGFRWVRSTVADIERGQRGLTAEEIFALPIAFPGAELHELVDPAPAEWVMVGERGYVIKAVALHAIATGKWDRLSAGQFESKLREKGLLAQDPEDASLAVRVEWEARREAELHAANVLGQEPITVARAAHKLWKIGLTEERDRRAAESDTEADPARRKGHVTRGMLLELTEHFEKGKRR